MGWKAFLTRPLNWLGYDLHKVLRPAEYSPNHDYHYVAYSPWFKSPFKEIWPAIDGKALVSMDRAFMVYEFARQCRGLEGEFAECGVYKGGTAYVISKALQGHPAAGTKKLHLFDTFAGMPKTADQDPSYLREGHFGDVSLDGVKAFLKDFQFTVYHPGFIPDTLAPVKDRRFAFAHIDVDIYQTTKDCCEFFYDRMSRGGVMLFDDYGDPGLRDSEKRAVDEFFEGKKESPVYIPTGQAFVIKL